MLRRTASTSIAIVVTLAVIGSAQQPDVDLVAESLVKSRLESGLVAQKQRQATIQSLFSDAGCSAEEQRVDRNSGNVVCTLPGQTSATIIVGGHFDFIDRGKGIVDDWSGSSLLPSLYQALKNRAHRHTYVFVAFAAEEGGLVGSTRYVKALTTEQKAAIRAFVNLECLGLNPVKVWTSRSNPDLLLRLREVLPQWILNFRAST